GHAGFDDDLLRPAARVEAPDHQRREQRMHLARLVVELDLPEQPDVLGVGRVDDVFVLLPVAAYYVATVGQPVAARGDDDKQQKRRGCGDGEASHGRLEAPIYQMSAQIEFAITAD